MSSFILKGTLLNNPKPKRKRSDPKHGKRDHIKAVIQFCSANKLILYVPGIHKAQTTQKNMFLETSVGEEREVGLVLSRGCKVKDKDHDTHT